MKYLLSKPIVFLALCMFLQDAAAQQLPLLNVYRDHWNILNPASLSNNYLINEMNLSVGASYRNQWFKLEDSPTTQILNFEYIFPEYDRVVTGGHVIRDQTGLIDQMGLYGQFAYKLELGRRTDHALLFGLNAGFVQYRARIDEIEFAEEEVGALENNRVYYPDFGLGAFYHYEDLFYAGMSIPQTFGLSTVFRDTSGNRDYTIQRTQHLYGVVGGYLSVNWFGSDASFIEPSAWIRYVPGAPLSFDLNARYQVSEFFWAGVGGGFGLGTSLSSALRLETGLKMGESVNIYKGQLKVGFAFNIPLSKYRSFFGNSIEVNVIYSWFN